MTFLASASGDNRILGVMKSMASKTLKCTVSLTTEQKNRTASATKNWLDRLTNDNDCHFDNNSKPLTFWNLTDRIATQAGIDLGSLPPGPFKPTINLNLLMWASRNLGVADLWKNVADKDISPSSGLLKKGVSLQRHSFFGYTLDNINCIDLTFTTRNSIDLGYGFWLIEKDVNFAYAILHYIMFRAWCGLTANREGKADFTVGMWGTFPIPNIGINKLSALPTPLSKEVESLFKSEGDITVKEAIVKAGEWLQKGWKKNSNKIPISFDECMDELCGFPNLVLNLSELSRLSLSKTELQSLDVDRFRGETFEDIIAPSESKEDLIKLSLEERVDNIDKLYGFGSLGNLKLSELPALFLSEEVKDIFKPLGQRNASISVRDAIRRAGEWQEQGWTAGKGVVAKARKASNFSKCIGELCSEKIFRYSLRVQILAQGFLRTFYS